MNDIASRVERVISLREEVKRLYFSHCDHKEFGDCQAAQESYDRLQRVKDALFAEEIALLDAVVDAHQERKAPAPASASARPAPTFNPRSAVKAQPSRLRRGAGK